MTVHPKTELLVELRILRVEGHAGVLESCRRECLLVGPRRRVVGPGTGQRKEEEEQAARSHVLPGAVPQAVRVRGQDGRGADAAGGARRRGQRRGHALHDRALRQPHRRLRGCAQHPPGRQPGLHGLARLHLPRLRLRPRLLRP